MATETPANTSSIKIIIFQPTCASLIHDKAGAADFLVKPVTSNILLAAIERAIARHDVSRKLQSELNLLRARVATLTPRERQVFDLGIRGRSNKQIAFALGPTERTIKAHRHVVMEKMKVRSGAELGLNAEQRGLL